jgi:hypothetical protein
MTDEQHLDIPTAAEMRERIDAQLARWARRSGWEVELGKKVFVSGIERHIQRKRQEAELCFFGQAGRREQLLEYARVLEEEELPRLRSAPSARD